MQIQAAVVREGQAPFTIETLEMTGLAPGEVLVRIAATGLCHTDLVVRDQVLPTPLPIVLGHEGAGVVAAVAPDVTSLSVGDKVIMGFAACRACEQCLSGQPAYCTHFTPLNFAGARRDGSTCLHDHGHPVASHFFGQSSFATHAIAAAHNLVKIAPEAPLELFGPLGCGIMTGAGAVMHALKLRAGESFLVSGAGPVGLSAVMAAHASGAGMIIVSDPLASRRAFALDVGATHALDPADGPLTEQVMALCPQGVQTALDTSGLPQVIESVLSTLAPLGRMAMVGVPRDLADSISLNLLTMLAKGIEVRGVTEGNADPQTFLPELIDLHAQGRFPFDRMISLYPLAKINEAVEDQHAGRCIKAVITMS